MDSAAITVFNERDFESRESTRAKSMDQDQPHRARKRYSPNHQTTSSEFTEDETGYEEGLNAEPQQTLSSPILNDLVDARIGELELRIRDIFKTGVLNQDSKLKLLWDLRRSSYQNSLFETLLKYSSRSTKPYAFDMAIDIMRDADAQILTHLYDSFPLNDEEKGTWYILLMSIARADIPLEKKIFFLKPLVQHESARIRHSVLSAIAQLHEEGGEHDSKVLLSWFATEDDNEFIRKSASYALLDLS